jgi:hypothetical protein
MLEGQNSKGWASNLKRENQKKKDYSIIKLKDLEIIMEDWVLT